MSTLGAVPSAAASLLSTSQIAPGKPFLLRCRISDQGEYHPCSARISGYIEEYKVFKAKGIEGTYVVARNDHATGLRSDATPLLGAPRSKRYVMIVNDNHVASLAVEDDSSKVIDGRKDDSNCSELHVLRSWKKLLCTSRM
ncbi:uncharacterized protein ARMOST_10234 [Armillaria ostoyae]|uniref:Uncharacterized protein n=1 Tax=Armillaria ostoyae TaxID=47428 RepID=A0A284RDR6_ARMOS|nr:uncharacterized protein ARMOST_10234 [Armillaria ostoyae]